MKKILLMMGTAFSALALSVSCTKDGNGGGTDPALLDAVNATYVTGNETNALELTYSDAQMVGKQAAFSTADGKTAKIVLSGTKSELLSGLVGADVLNAGVVPGEVSTTLNVELVPGGEGFTFQGEDKSNGRELVYSGSVVKGKLDIKVNVKFQNSKLSGKWNLAPADETNQSPAPLILNWGTEKKFPIIPGFIEFNPGELLTMASAVMQAQSKLASVFKSITFNADGNILVSYSDAENSASPVWQDSPLNFAHYTLKGEKLYAYLNVEALISMLLPTASKAFDPMTLIPHLMPALSKMSPMFSNGIPLRYTVAEDGSMSLYIDNEVGMILNEAIVAVARDKDIMDALKEMIANDPNFGSLASFMTPVFEHAAEVFASTTEIKVGLMFQPEAISE